MRSDAAKKGPQRGPHRSLMKATGLTDADIRKPLIGVVNSYADTAPGHVHLDAVGVIGTQAADSPQSILVALLAKLLDTLLPLSQRHLPRLELPTSAT